MSQIEGAVGGATKEEKQAATLEKSFPKASKLVASVGKLVVKSAENVATNILEFISSQRETKGLLSIKEHHAGRCDNLCQN